MNSFFPFIGKSRAMGEAARRRTTTTESRAILEKLDALRTELVDLAFTLERRGRIDAADIAITTSARVGELYDELATLKLSGSE